MEILSGTDFIRIYLPGTDRTEEILTVNARESEKERLLRFADPGAVPFARREKPSASLTERLLRVQLDEERADIINQAILGGLDEQLILMLLDGNLSAEDMRKLLEVFAGDA